MTRTRVVAAIGAAAIAAIGAVGLATRASAEDTTPGDGTAACDELHAEMRGQMPEDLRDDADAMHASMSVSMSGMSHAAHHGG